MHTAVCRGENELFEVGTGNGVWSLDGHCKAGPGHLRGSGAGRGRMYGGMIENFIAHWCRSRIRLCVVAKVDYLRCGMATAN